VSIRVIRAKKLFPGFPMTYQLCAMSKSQL
jgi:hypothetical protein